MLLDELNKDFRATCHAVSQCSGPIELSGYFRWHSVKLLNSLGLRVIMSCLEKSRNACEIRPQRCRVVRWKWTKKEENFERHARRWKISPGRITNASGIIARYKPVSALGATTGSDAVLVSFTSETSRQMLFLPLSPLDPITRRITSGSLARSVIEFHCSFHDAKAFRAGKSPVRLWFRSRDLTFLQSAVSQKKKKKYTIHNYRAQLFINKNITQLGYVIYNLRDLKMKVSEMFHFSLSYFDVIYSYVVTSKEE